MKYLLIGIILCGYTLPALSQNTLLAIIRSEEDNSPLAGATVTWREQNRTVLSDSTGQVKFENIPNGTHNFSISYVGMEELNLTYTFPLSSNTPMEIIMEEEGDHHDEEEVVVRSTRTSRTISNTPTRTEVISGEELAEKGNMKPGDIRMLLNESTGIQTQQTSATSFNAGIRIQGLEGRYTQILRDGYPLYSGFSGGLSILQIAPLDLRQVEVIKGSSSTLYGGGAIAGLVNLISKTPGKEREISFMGNATSAKGLDLSGFYSQGFEKVGLTVFASRNTNAAFDPADIGFTAIPEFQRYLVNPRLFLYGNKTTTDFGLSYITEDRIGGNMAYIKNGGSGFFESNNTDRVTGQFGSARKLNEKTLLQLKSSYTRFDRRIAVPAYVFEGLQQSSFSELTLNTTGLKSDWVFGLNFLTDDLAERSNGIDPPRDYHFNTYGAFVQNSWAPTDKVVVETGLRGDYVTDYGLELLPRISAMFRLSPAMTTRIGGGFGYKTPTVFTEESERVQFRNILPIKVAESKNEKSVGGNWDINYKTSIGEVGVSFNHLFYYTRLNSPLALIGVPGGKMEYRNSTGYIDTKGMESNLRLIYGDFKLFIGYTNTDAETHFSSIDEWLPLTAKHRLNNVLMYEIEEKLKLGLEGYFFSKQRLNDGTTGKSYWIMGFMAEKLWENFSVFINFENFTDTRQSKFGPIYTGSLDAPIFKDIYAPVEGFVINGGLKLRL